MLDSLADAPALHRAKWRIILVVRFKYLKLLFKDTCSQSRLHKVGGTVHFAGDQKGRARPVPERGSQRQVEDGFHSQVSARATGQEEML